jgi:hypothetical protein
MKTGRNEPCACGSGKKSKNCCQAAVPSSPASGRIGMILATIAVVAAVAVIATTRKGADEAAVTSGQTATAPAPVNAPAPAAGTTPLAAPVAGPGAAQPPGPAPAGKVWSAEHGHWHDKPQTNEWVTVTPQKPAAPQSTTIPLNTSGSGLPAYIPQPQGPVPAGKVWAPEHGHWHDAKTGQLANQEIPKEIASQMRKPGIPEEMKNYVWNEEHKHWHRKDATGEHATAVILPPPGSSAAAATATAPENPPR